MNKQTLKKHHFWLLSGLVPLIVLIAFLLITNGVGGAIENHQANLKKSEGQLSQLKALKPKSLINELDTQVAVLKKKKGEMWQRNWEKQKTQFTWPKSPKYDELLRQGELAFGDPITNRNAEREEIKDEKVYRAEYERLAASVAPTQFLGDGPKEGGPGWAKVLRHVSTWDTRVPDSSWIWQAFEDIWVQRTMLGAVKAVNDQIAQFSEPKVDNTLSTSDSHYKCASRLWEVELWRERQGGDTVIRAKLKNVTDRLQILGVGNTLRLQIWLNNSDLDDESRAIEFPIEGEFVKAKSFAQATEKDPSPVIKELPAHRIKQGTPVTGIFKVRQKFDVRTVPVRMIEEVHLNYPDARHANKLLVPFKSDKKEESTDPAAKGGTAPPMRTGGEGAPTGTAGGGTVESVILANRDQRYLVVTDQVRRMPVMIRVVLDQMFVEDFLVALANMPLRFQTTQVDQTRFRGSLPSTGGSSGAPSGDGSDGPVLTTGETVRGTGFTTAGDPYRGKALPGVGRPVAAPATPGPAGSLTSVSEGQLTAGLVSVSAYGIISMYKKYTDDTPKEPK